MSNDSSPTPTIHHRHCTLEDLEALQYLGRATYEPYYKHVWHPSGVDFYMEHCFGADTLREQLSDPNIAYYLPSLPNGTPMGLLKLGLSKPTPDGRIANALFLEKIYLLPAFMGKGHGQAIIQYAIDMACSLGRDAVWLTVMEKGPVTAYERAGFVQSGAVDYGFSLLQPAYRKGLVMVKML